MQRVIPVTCLLIAVSLSAAAHPQSPPITEAELFLEALPPDSIEPDYVPILVNGTPDIFYPPADVSEPHPAQYLHVFLPSTPAPPSGYPTLLYFPSGAFKEQIAVDRPFLTFGLDNGWAIVAVGTTGIDSWPTCTQLQDCDPCVNCGNTQTGGDPGCPNHTTYPCPGSGPTFCDQNPAPQPAGPCANTNLWTDPDVVGTAWDSFTYFSGEKDAVWARQFIAEQSRPGNSLAMLNNDKVVALGTSGGGVYAAFLALQPNRAGSFSGVATQLDEDTRVAGLLVFEPIDWYRALPDAGAGAKISGAHWPTTVNSLSRTEGAISLVAPNLLITSCPSTWTRGFGQSKVPVFLASGDGSALSTGFGRSVASDYDRLGSGDPALVFPFPTPLRLHDGWQAIMWMDDLDLTDARYSDRHCRLFLREDVEWERIPPKFYEPGVTVPVGADDVTIVDGEYSSDCGGGTTLCGSISNQGLAAPILDWLEREFCLEDDPSFVTCVNAGDNYAVYDATSAQVGQSITFSIAWSEVDSRYTEAKVLIWGTQGQAAMGNGNVRLVGPPELTEALTIPEGTSLVSGPVPMSLLGTTLYTQAILFDTVGPIEVNVGFTNAQYLLVH